MQESLGMVETVGISTAIEVADVMVKAANVNLIEVENSRGGGYMTVKVTGDVGAVKAAVMAAKAQGEQIGKIVSATVIARPAEEMAKLFCEPEVPYKSVNKKPVSYVEKKKDSPKKDVKVTKKVETKKSKPAKKGTKAKSSKASKTTSAVVKKVVKSTKKASKSVSSSKVVKAVKATKTNKVTEKKEVKPTPIKDTKTSAVKTTKTNESKKINPRDKVSKPKKPVQKKIEIKQPEKKKETAFKINIDKTSKKPSTDPDKKN